MKLHSKQYEADLAAVKKANAANEADYQAKLTAYQTELARVQKANARMLKRPMKQL